MSTTQEQPRTSHKPKHVPEHISKLHAASLALDAAKATGDKAAIDAAEQAYIEECEKALMAMFGGMFPEA
jgi:hypothetical protein